MPLLLPPTKQLSHGTIARNASQSANPSLWRGLVGAWDATLGITSASDGLLRDESGFGRHGTLTGPMIRPTYGWNISELGYMIKMEGSNDHVDVGTFPQTVGEYTAAGWARHLTTTNGTLIDHSSGANDGWRVSSAAANAFSLTLGGVAGYTFSSLTFPGATDAAWSFWAVTVKGTTATGYVNNGSETKTIGALVGTPSTLIMGRLKFTSANHWSGEIAKTFVWNRALAPNEVKKLYQDHLAPFRRRDLVIPYATPAAASGLPIPVAMHHYTHNLRG